LGELTGLFVLVWLRKNVKVIQAGKDALLAKLKNVPKPKKAASPTPQPQALQPPAEATWEHKVCFL